ncbi:CotH family protein [Leucobacter tenebrionis]|uniref:hypothetical protein n=1 Tax=Leucobacter tenebrionis TaxID=2873270 RepID=UPI001CA61BB3|nr:hypothetical protein [Leucobacter tenebrionis]QZY51523.1 hypothetical protein KVY00_13300 [Leucobacter tenebrionis]
MSFENVGLKLKGNSSLRGISAQSDPATLPWIIRLDRFVDDRTWDGWSEPVVHANSSETSLNEAIALSLFAETGLAAEAAVSSSFSVNGGGSALRLIVQNSNEQWTETNFGEGALLYKSEGDGGEDFGGGQGGMSRSNVLAERFRANEEFGHTIDDAASALQAELIDSGRAAESLDQRQNTLTGGAVGEVVSADTVRSEASQIAEALGIE